MTDSLPKGWELPRVVDVGELRLGKQRAPKWHLGPNMRPYLRVANVFEDRIDISDVKSMHFEPNEVATFELRLGDVLLNEGQSPELLGRPAIYRGELAGVCFTNSLIRFRPAAGVLSEWALAVFRHHMHSGRFRRESQITTNIAHLSLGRLAGVEFPLPPTAEQERIVAAIDEQFSRLNVAEELLRSARSRCAQMRSTFLSRTVRGDWPAKALGEVLLVLRNGIFVSRPSPSPPGVPIYRISAVRPLQLDVSDIRYADIPAEKAERYIPSAGDLLFTRYSGNPSYVGACAVVPVANPMAMHPDKLIRAVVDPSLAIPEFVAIAVNVGSGRHQIEQRLKTTAGQVGIAGGQLKSVEIPVPPLDEQRRVVGLVEQTLSLVDALGAAIDHALVRAERLRRAILQAAVAGKLVSPDPDPRASR